MENQQKQRVDKTYSLPEGRYLTDLKMTPLAENISLVIAPTGIGKTTWTMKKLRKEFPIVWMLVPSVLKVQELETEWKSYSFKKKKRYRFFSENKLPNSDDLSTFNGVIVSTYDKFERIHYALSNVQKQQSLLVLDECHKLYSVGSFRDSALTPIIHALQKRVYKNVLALTATFTFDRWRVLDIPIDIKHTVSKVNPKSVDLTIQYLSKGDQYSFIHKLVARIDQLKLKNQQSKKIIVRVNNRKRCEGLAEYLNQFHGVNSLVVHSRNKNKADVQDIFDAQKIPEHIQVVITTSILDEAVNINNSTEEIDSVFIVGKTAHPEEIIQFIGRLRYAKVPCFLILHTAISSKKIDVEKEHAAFQKKIELFCEKISKIAEMLTNIMQDCSDLAIFDNEVVVSLHEKAKKLNAVFEEICGCKLFVAHARKVLRNYASIAAVNYRTDTSLCYGNIHYLKHRLQQLKPELCVDFQEDSHTVTSQEVIDFFKAEQTLTQEQYQKSIYNGMEIFLNDYSKNEFKERIDEKEKLDKQRGKKKQKISKIYELAVIADVHSEKLKNDPEFLHNQAMFRRYQYPEACAEATQHIIHLAKYISSIKDIISILNSQSYDRVSAVVYGYENNLIVQYLMKRFYRYGPEKYLTGSKEINEKEAQNLVKDALVYLHKNLNIPMKSIAAGKLVKGLSFDSKTDTFSILGSKAFNFISKYFEVKDINRKKPQMRRLQFHGIEIGGYKYNFLDHIHRPNMSNPTSEKVVINGFKYDNFSGKAYSKAKKGSLDDI